MSVCVFVSKDLTNHRTDMLNSPPPHFPQMPLEIPKGAASIGVLKQNSFYDISV